MDDENFSFFMEIVKALEAEDLSGSNVEKAVMNIITMFKSDLTEQQMAAIKENIAAYRARLKNKTIEETYKDSRDWD